MPDTVTLTKMNPYLFTNTKVYLSKLAKKLLCAMNID